MCNKSFSAVYKKTDTTERTVIPVDMSIEDILMLAADMDKLCSGDDALGELVRQTETDELDEFDLDLVAAAASVPPAPSFQTLRSTRGK